MAKYRSDLRTGVRDKLSAWPELVTTLTEDLDSSENGVDLAAVTNVIPQSLLEIDSEILGVISVSSLTATVLRGWRGSTAATHSNGTQVKVYPKWGWTDAHLNRYINRAITWLGEGMVWSLVPRTNTFLSGYRDFGLPSGTTYPHGNIVKKLEVLGSDGLYRESLHWRHQGDRIYLNQVLTSDQSVRIWVQQHQAELSDDTTALDQDKYLEVLELYVAGRCLEELLANRTRYTDYSAALNDRASQPDELQRQAYFFMNQAIILRDQMSRPGLAGRASFQYNGD